MKQFFPSQLLLRLSPCELSVCVFTMLFGGFGLGMAYFYVQVISSQQAAVKTDVMHLVKMVSILVDMELHEQLIDPDQVGEDTYRKALKPLVGFHRMFPDIHYVYTMRVDREGNEFFVLDTAMDATIRGLLEAKGRAVMPSPLMSPYSDVAMTEKVKATMKQGESYVYEAPYEDEFGRFISGQTPLFDADGQWVGYVGVDYNLEAFERRLDAIKTAGIIVCVFIFLVSLILARLSYKVRSISVAQMAQLKSTEALMREAKGRAEAANHAKSELLAIAVHDLKNPLSAISGVSTMLMNSITEESDPESYEMLELILQGADQMSQLVRGILNNEGLEQSGLTYNPSPFDISQIGHDMCAFSRPLAENKMIEIVERIEPNVDVYGDAPRLREAFDNLLGNALKFSPANTTIEVELKRVNGTKEVEFSIKDEGPGISAADEINLFRKFQKLSARPTNGEASFGLGLSIVKTIAEMHGGSVGCDRDVEIGVRFWIRIPSI